MRPKLCCTLTLALLMSGPLLAGPGKGSHHGQKGRGKAKHARKSNPPAPVDIGVSLGRYRHIMRDYLDHRPAGSLPPGLAKRGGDLPPGLAKHLHKNGTLPPGLQKRLTPYPADLSRQLPYLGDEYGGGFLNGRAVVFNKSTSAILDVFIP